jgi:hypothetical protein
MKYQSSPERLIILSEQNAPVNQYRVRRRDLEFRALDAQGRPFRFSSRWRKLTAEEIALHLNLNTPVAEWLNARLLSRASRSGVPVEFSSRERTHAARAGALTCRF